MKTIFKTECRIRRKFSENIITILDTYGYEEISLFGARDYLTNLLESADKFLFDEIKPIRLFSFNNDNVYSLVVGADEVMGFGESLVVLINSLLSLGVKEFKITLSGDNAKEIINLLTEYELSDYAKLGNDTGDTVFEVLDVSDNKLLAKGEKIKNGVCFSLDMGAVVDILYDEDIVKDSLLPVAVVGSQYPSFRHKVSFGLRAQGLKIEEFIQKGTMTDMFEYAEIKGIAVSIWADGENIIMKNMKTGESSQTTMDKLLGEKK